ncbi:hypothetical protein LEP3755_29310 [Leptolyngbya sp. NIES-3755]|nr:hypothetical protein LEP3755_29310 [Leptolyngbya sp. NIES-3755]
MKKSVVLFDVLSPLFEGVEESFEVLANEQKFYFRTAVFGTAGTRNPKNFLQDAAVCGEFLAEIDSDIIEGGGGHPHSVMSVVAEAFRHHRSKLESSAIAIANSLLLPWEDSEQIRDYVLQSKSLSLRLLCFASLSSAFVILPGGWGTMLEVAFVGQLIDHALRCRSESLLWRINPSVRLGWIPPMIAVGNSFDWLKEFQVAGAELDTLSRDRGSDQLVTVVKDIEEAKVLLKQSKIQWEKCLSSVV